MLTENQRVALLPAVEILARRAGAAILGLYQSGTPVIVKHDGSPVTAADHASDAILRPGLAALTPDIPVVSEEGVEAGDVPDISGGNFWLVDPLDGTKEFIKRNGEFTVNIGEVVDGVPVAGVVFAPALGRLFVGSQADGAFETDAELANVRAIVARPRPADGLVVVGSRSHSDAQTEAFLKSLKVREFKSAGSSLKFCLVAAGEADLYPRTGPTMEWDTAAGHAVLLAAGGDVTNWDGTRFCYGKPGFNNPGFIACGRASS
jgi:3'(2'), 5'-bisphosphate nucleotidase